MNFDYIRETYKVPAKRGMKVQYRDAQGELHDGVITSTRGAYLMIRMTPLKHPRPYHPTYCLDYFDKDGKCIFKSLTEG